MKVSSKWMRWLMVVAALAVVVGVAVVAVPGAAQAAANIAGPWGFGMRGVDTNANSDKLLADALGITTDELSAAQTEARDAALAQAVTDGRLTQEQADLIKARWAFDAFVAEKMKTAYDEAVAAAVTEGVVTQEQADAFTKGGDFLGHGPMGWDMPDDATPGQMPNWIPGGMHMRSGGRSR